MLLNFAAPKLAPNIVASPKSNIDVNAVLGLAPSQYEGLQSVGDTGYYYGDNKMYEAYTPSPSYFYMNNSPFGMRTYQPTGMMPAQPSYSPIFGYSGGWQRGGGAAAGTITRDGQSFKPVDTDVTGFSKSKIGDTEQYEYTPSMAYVYANTPRPAPVPTPNVTSFLSTPTAMATPQGNYGAGRFLGNGLLGGLEFGLPSGQSANTGGTS
jgi:hypothetical protein